MIGDVACYVERVSVGIVVGLGQSIIFEHQPVGTGECWSGLVSGCDVALQLAREPLFVGVAGVDLALQGAKVGVDAVDDAADQRCDQQRAQVGSPAPETSRCYG